MILQDHVIKWSCNFKKGILSWQINFMPSLMGIKNRAVEIYLLIFRFIHMITCSKDYLTLCLELHHSKFPLCYVHWSSATGNITYLICHISLQDHEITRITWISRFMWYFGWKLLIICHHPTNFDSRWYYGSGI